MQAHTSGEDSRHALERVAAFFAAFNDIEKELRSRFNADHNRSFNNMVRNAEKRNWLTHNHSELLQEYSELRNAIAHGAYTDSLIPIAIPLQETVDSIAAIRDHFIDPPTALDVLGKSKRLRQPVYFSPEDSGTDLLKNLAGAAGVSKFPVYEGRTFYALLTAESLMHWAANSALAGKQADYSVQLREIISDLNNAGKYYAAHHRVVFLPRTATAQEAVVALTTPLEQGHLPKAVIINEHGKQEAKPLAIVSGGDIAALLDAIPHSH